MPSPYDWSNIGRKIIKYWPHDQESFLEWTRTEILETINSVVAWSKNHCKNYHWCRNYRNVVWNLKTYLWPWCILNRKDLCGSKNNTRFPKFSKGDKKHKMDTKSAVGSEKLCRKLQEKLETISLEITPIVPLLWRFWKGWHNFT